MILLTIYIGIRQNKISYVATFFCIFCMSKLFSNLLPTYKNSKEAFTPHLEVEKTFCTGLGSRKMI